MCDNLLIHFYQNQATLQAHCVCVCLCTVHILINPHISFISCKNGFILEAFPFAKIDRFAICVPLIVSVCFLDLSGITVRISLSSYSRLHLTTWKKEWLCVMQTYLSRYGFFSPLLWLDPCRTHDISLQLKYTCLISWMSSYSLVIISQTLFISNKRCGKNFNDEREW